jgi:hypothetical protein
VLGQKAFAAAELAGRNLTPLAALANARKTLDTHHVPITSHDHHSGTTSEHLAHRTQS